MWESVEQSRLSFSSPRVTFNLSLASSASVALHASFHFTAVEHSAPLLSVSMLQKSGSLSVTVETVFVFLWQDMCFFISSVSCLLPQPFLPRPLPPAHRSPATAAAILLTGPFSWSVFAPFLCHVLLKRFVSALLPRQPFRN